MECRNNHGHGEKLITEVMVGNWPSERRDGDGGDQGHNHYAIYSYPHFYFNIIFYDCDG